MIVGWSGVLVVLVETVCANDTAPPIIDMHLHASRLADFERLAGPAPIPHCVPMTDYPVPESGSGWPEVFRSRELACDAAWSPSTDDDWLLVEPSRDKAVRLLERKSLLKRQATGRVVALVGSSGVGKSTLVNTLAGRKVQLTSGIRGGDAHGRHTTTSSSLPLLEHGALLLDVPQDVKR